MRTYLNFFGTRISVMTREGLMKEIERLNEMTGSSYITFSNVHVVVTGTKDEILRQAINEADVASPDGMPLVVAGKTRKLNIERCTGPDMMRTVFEKGMAKGYSHYFYGSTEATLEVLEASMTERYPGNVIKGTCSPPFRPLTEEEDAAIVKEINDLDPDFVWVGLGAPKQEKWMHDHKTALKDCVMFGVGAAFDFHADKISRAPVWMQNSGLEWFYRLIKEPKRLFTRYMYTNFMFLVNMIRYGVKIEREG